MIRAKPSADAGADQGGYCGRSNGGSSSKRVSAQERCHGLEDERHELRADSAGNAEKHGEIESPLAIHYKGITITPGGFLAGESVYRNRATGGEATAFNSLFIPAAARTGFPNSMVPAASRKSRCGRMARLASCKLTGYYEADFLRRGTTSNNNQTNSYALRQRQAWGQVAFDNGWSFTGGQMWTLLTEN